MFLTFIKSSTPWKISNIEILHPQWCCYKCTFKKKKDAIMSLNKVKDAADSLRKCYRVFTVN